MTTLSAVTLVVPAGVALVRFRRHAHVAEADRSTRLVRLVVAATVVGLGALVVTAVAGSGPPLASVTALVLAGAVLASAPAASTWAVRGVVTWALITTGAVAFLGWLAHRMLVAPVSATELAVGGAAWSLASLALIRLRGHVRGWAASRASGSTAMDSVTGPGPVGSQRRAVLWLAALGAASTVAVVVSTGGLGPTQARPTQAGQSGSAATDPAPSDGRSSGASPSSATGQTRLETSDGAGESGGGRGLTATRRTSAPTSEGGARPSTDAPPATATTSATATISATPAEQPEAEPTSPVKTPGYAKEKPNRPADAPSPGPKLP